MILKPVKLKSDDPLEKSAESLLKNIDVLWLISDSSKISSIENVSALFELAEKSKVPVITYNPLFMDLGAVMSLASDLSTTFRQAALLAQKLLDNEILDSSTQFPAGSQII